MFKRIAILAISIGLLQVLSAAAPVTSASTALSTAGDKETDIRRLMHLTGSDKIGRQVVDQMITSFKESMPDVPESTWAEVRAEADPDGMVELIIPIYDRHLTHEQIKGLVRFFESSEGQAYIQAMPRISQDTIEVGQQWGLETAQRMIKKLEENAPPEVEPMGR